MSIKEHPPHLHVPVLLEATLDALHPQVGESYLDLTAGYGGHATQILEQTENYQASYLVDRDDMAIKSLEPLRTKGCNLLHTDFVTATKQLINQGKQFDLILVDLGVSSPQLDLSERGFSFKSNGPLDMRMDPRQSVTAESLLNTASVEELTDIITKYGEEPYGFARRVAEAIVDQRPLKDTQSLARLVELQYRKPRRKIHPATRTFQAIRIAVNQELWQVEELLPMIPELLNKGGRVAIISFHSLEDRLVKRYFQSQFKAGFEARLAPVTKKPLDGLNYDVHNPRSRSAKLRVAVKK